ncbi:MAG: hypothetical protein ABH872_02610 [Candidatus Omnitrophota bacterium]
MYKRFKFFLVSCILVLIFACSTIKAQEAYDLIVFRHRLSESLLIAEEYFELTLQEPGDMEKFQQAIFELNEFSSIFPESKFADDAQFLSSSLIFFDALFAEEEQDAKKALVSLEDVIKRYPVGAVEDFTIKQCEEIIGKRISTVFLYIGYFDILAYMKGRLAWDFNNYHGVIDNYIVLKEKINTKLSKTGLPDDIYTMLVASHIKLKEFDTARNLAQEAIDKYPHNGKLKKWMKDVLKSIEGGF